MGLLHFDRVLKPDHKKLITNKQTMEVGKNPMMVNNADDWIFQMCNFFNNIIMINQNQF